MILTLRLSSHTKKVAVARNPAIPSQKKTTPTGAIPLPCERGLTALPSLLPTAVGRGIPIWSSSIAERQALRGTETQEGMFSLLRETKENLQVAHGDARALPS